MGRVVQTSPHLGPLPCTDPQLRCAAARWWKPWGTASPGWLQGSPLATELVNACRNWPRSKELGPGLGPGTLTTTAVPCTTGSTTGPMVAQLRVFTDTHCSPVGSKPAPTPTPGGARGCGPQTWAPGSCAGVMLPASGQGQPTRREHRAGS